MAAEEIRLGNIDPVDEFCVISIFDEASQYLSGNSRIKLTTDQKLSFYGLFKQATLGPCDRPKPGLLEMVEKAKWSAWKKLGKMSKDDAIAAYVRLLDQVAPQWKTELGDLDNGDDAEEEKEADKGGGGLQVSPIVSRPVHTDDGAPQLHDLCFFASQGDRAQVEALLAGGVPLTYANEDGQSALMLAVDRGEETMVDLILQRAKAAGGDTVSAVLGQQDGDGMTALHYACVCDMKGCARMLVEAGADPAVKNGEEEDCWQCANDAIKAVMKTAASQRQQPPS